MADINTGTALRFENGGEILFGTDKVLNVVEGTLRFTIPGVEPVVYRDRSVLQDPIPGNEREVEGSFDIRYTSACGADAIWAAVHGALVSTKISPIVSATGKLFTFSMTVKIFDGRGVATGTQYVFSKCYLDPIYSYQAASGTETDKLTLTFKDCEASPAITTF